MPGLLALYEQNYEQIAADHVRHWRRSGKNPFQNYRAQKMAQKHAVLLVRRFALEGGKLLDCGCGMGDLLLALRANYEVSGVEIATPYLEVARERDLHVVRAFIEDMPFPDETFDTVVATDVLEHVLDLHGALTEILRVLKPGGVLIVRVPDSEDLSQYLDPNLAYRFVHLRRFDEAVLRITFNRVYGCEILHVEKVGIAIQMAVRK